MEKLGDKRYYFDYNATSPLLEIVKEVLSCKDFPFANPVSSHSDGKRAKRILEECYESLYKVFGLKPSAFDLFFHSGATEAVNLLVKGLALYHQKISFAYTKTDHSCVRAQEKFLRETGHHVFPIDVDSQGNCQFEDFLEKVPLDSSPFLLNWTWVNNETGVVFSLEDAVSFKEKTGAFVHVDAVQSVGKIRQWQNLHPKLDAYTYSAHKFGGPKGIGLTFLKKGFPFTRIISGGGQQRGLRAGTENVLGVKCATKALEFVAAHYDYTSQREAKEALINQLETTLKTGGIVVGKKAREVNGQTVSFIFKHERSDIVSLAFDLAGIDISTGAACSSGGVIPSPILLAMGFDKELARSAIRFSFSPYVNRELMKEYASKILPVAARFSKL